MTEIPGTTIVSSKKRTDEEAEHKIQLQSVVDVGKIKKSRAKPTELSFDNVKFKNWVIITSVLVFIFVVFLCLFSLRFGLLVFSGPGIGVVSFYLKEKLVLFFNNNDLVIRRYIKS